MSRIVAILLTLLLFGAAVHAQEAPPPTPAPSSISYTVQLNDTLGAIAFRNRTTISAIMRLNNLTSSEVIIAGQTLLIPVPATPQPVEATEQVVATPAPVEISATETAAVPPIVEVTPVVPVPPALASSFDYGVEAIFDNQDVASVVAQINGMGMHWAKVRVSWRAMEAVQGSIDYTRLDEIVNALAASNRQILLTISNAPDWARSSTTENGPPDNFDDYASFTGAVAARYTGRVQAYEIWHEPNLRREWNSILYAIGAEPYAELLRRAYFAIKTADPAAVVVSAGLAPTGFNDGINALDDRQFLASLYQFGLPQISDAVGAHPFGFANPPEALCCTASPGVLTHFEHPSFYFTDTLEDYHDIMLANGDTARTIWVTEFGWGTSEDMSAPPATSSFIGDNTLAEQAQYLIHAFELGASSGYVGVMIAYNLNSCIAQPANTDACYYSLTNPAGQPRPAYNGLGMMFLPAIEN